MNRTQLWRFLPLIKFLVYSGLGLLWGLFAGKNPPLLAGGIIVFIFIAVPLFIKLEDYCDPRLMDAENKSESEHEADG